MRSDAQLSEQLWQPAGSGDFQHYLSKVVFAAGTDVPEGMKAATNGWRARSIISCWWPRARSMAEAPSAHKVASADHAGWSHTTRRERRCVTGSRSGSRSMPAACSCCIFSVVGARCSAAVGYANLPESPVHSHLSQNSGERPTGDTLAPPPHLICCVRLSLSLNLCNGFYIWDDSGE